ncbi:AI-2E family transporter [Dethiobacter alkaliphilus]|uniref:AI-2E family transporter n=1 Tax=Dethiobacter alkaliphilus TaxID=427926 RepID=UPI002225D66E|nr:AI-2E family transporter [Dethiobacter alkaliphilus]MCW3491576.1 AI-2E family transporter [Dethiobacter alkaliphilus]
MVILLFQTKTFQFTVWLLLLFLLIWLGQQINFIFRPIVVFIASIFLPVLLSGILYYLLKPIVNLLIKWKFPRTAAILFIYLVFSLIIIFVLLFLIPILQGQLINLVNNAPALLAQLQTEFVQLQESTFFSQVRQLESSGFLDSADHREVVDNLVSAALLYFSNLAGVITNFLMVAFTIPFILFYMLKDGQRLPETISRLFPKPYRKESEDILNEMSDAISSYIQGQLIVCLFVGIFVYLGYLIVGLEYALLLAVVAAVTNIIPYFGPVIGTVPGLIVAFIQSPWTALQVLVIVIVIQQLESQIISPQVLGKKLSIHPVAIIFSLLTGGSLAGLPGLILAVPTYAVGRVVVTHLFILVQKQA